MEQKINLKDRLKKAFGLLLVAGLILEVVEAVKADKEVAVANLEAKQAGTNAAASYERAALALRAAGQANERAADTESNNLVLQAKLIPRTITMTQVTNFIFFTEEIAKIPIKIHPGSQGDDILQYAFNLRFMLDKAGFQDDSNLNGIKIDKPGDTIHFVFHPVGRSGEWPSVVFVGYSTNDVLNLGNISLVVTNGFFRPFVLEQTPSKIYSAVEFCFMQIGIKTEWYAASNWVAPGEFEIFIPPKNN